MNAVDYSLLPDLACCSVPQWQYLVWQPHDLYPRKQQNTCTHTLR